VFLAKKTSRQCDTNSI